MKIILKVDELEEHIVRRNISQNNFARRAGISSAYMAQLLTGKRKPAGPVREKLMEASGLAFDQLFDIVRDEVVATQKGAAQ